MTSSPIWRGGGRAFPSSPLENFSHKINRKAYRAGMQTILSELVRQERLNVVEEFVVATPKTKAFAEKIKNLGFEGGVLVLTDGFDENLYLSSRNPVSYTHLDVYKRQHVNLFLQLKKVCAKQFHQAFWLASQWLTLK